jgi:hypothetical protein
MTKLLGSVAAAGLATLVAGQAIAAPLAFRATLTGDQEVPPVETTTRGAGSFRATAGLDQLRYELRVTNGTGVTQAHLHCAPAGVNGPVVAFLFGPANPAIDVSGKLAAGTIENAQIMATEGEPCGATINNVASLYAAILEGRVYANVHTTDNPAGEVRSQLFP